MTTNGQSTLSYPSLAPPCEIGGRRHRTKAGGSRTATCRERRSAPPLMTGVWRVCVQRTLVLRHVTMYGRVTLDDSSFMLA